MKTNIISIVLFLLVLSCKTNLESSKMEKVDSFLIAKGNLYGSGAEGLTAQNLVIDNQGEWNSLVNKMDSVNKVSDTFEETKIDFSKFNVIAVFDEVKGSGGHSLELIINSNSKNRIVNVSHLAPEGSATTVMTQPFYIVKIAKSKLPIVFK
jgi:hypothetical protein